MTKVDVITLTIGLVFGSLCTSFCWVQYLYQMGFWKPKSKVEEGADE